MAYPSVPTNNDGTIEVFHPLAAAMPAAVVGPAVHPSYKSASVKATASIVLQYFLCTLTALYSQIQWHCTKLSMLTDIAAVGMQ